jgi:hypothetical protein
MIRCCAAALLIVGLVPALAAEPAAALLPKTFTWSGGGATNDWGDGANWQGNEAPPSAGNSIVDLSQAGVSTIDGADGQITDLTVVDGTTLIGSGLTITGRLTAKCARLDFDNFILAGSGELVGGIIEGRFTNAGSSLVHRTPRITDCQSTDGGMKTPYTSVAAGAEVINDGVWRGQDASLRGLSCCGAPTSSKVVHGPTGVFRGDGVGIMTLESVVVESRGRFEGAVFLDGSRTRLIGESGVGARGVRPGARLIMQGGGSTTLSGTVTVHRGAVLELRDENEQLVGNGRLDSPATPASQPAGVVRFAGGQVLNRVSVGPVAVVEQTSARSLFVRTLAATPGVLTVDGPTRLGGTGEIKIDTLASMVLKGDTRVTGRVTVDGQSCCRESEIPTLVIGGTVTVPTGAVLSVRSARFDLRGRTAGAGRVNLDFGLHVVSAGATLGTETYLGENADLTTPDGRVTVDKTLHLTGGAIQGPARPRGTVISGQGSLTWMSGGIGDVTLSIPVTMPASGSARGIVSNLTTTRSVSLSGPLIMFGGTTWTIDGNARFSRADIDASEIPAPLIDIRDRGSLRLVDGTSLALGANVRASAGVIDLDGHRLALGAGRTTLAEGRLLLGGGELKSVRLFTDGDSTVTGPGRISGDYVTNGVTRTARRGTIEVKGGMVATRNSRITLGRNDFVDVDGELSVAGTLVLDRVPRPAVSTDTLMRSQELDGRFDTVRGLPPGGRIEYTRSQVRIR